MPPKLNNDRALRIVAAARHEFASAGFAGARVDRIARRAGVNKQLLFYYYHSKRGLFQAVLSRGARELEQALATVPLAPGSAAGPLQRLRAALEAQFDFLARVRDDVDPHLTAAQALVLMIAYLGLESLIAASAPSLGSDEPALSRRWKEGAVRLVLEGVAAR